MQTKSKKILAGVIGMLFIALIVFGGWYFGFIPGTDRNIYARIKNNPELLAPYEQIQKDNETIKKTPDKVVAYIDLGLSWKTLGDLSPTDKNVFYQKARDAYQAGAQRFGTKNIIFYLNDGKVAELMGDYAGAEANYKKMIEISAGDESGYINLATLYDYKLHKTPAEILAVYNQGIAKLFNPIAVVGARGTYLRRIGDFQNALPDYELLVKNYPNNQGYKDIVEELKAKIKAGN